MKKSRVILILSIAVILVIGGSVEAGGRHKYCGSDNGFGLLPDDVSLDFDDGTLVIQSDDYDQTVEINDECDLYIDGRKIETDRDQERLLCRYYEDLEEIIELAKEIGVEGAMLGMGGAKIGLKAVINAAMLILEDYDSEDLEKELEKEAEKLERRAKKLEKKAEKIEDRADDFKKTHRKLRKAIPELKELEWF
ncbi:MAG: hypothetical protein JXB45_00910 [Candidatus Krumholzibacteriota bacterium]|nr:hypothetical protein [Candidatus Krumholzibacteriota bacterium]